MAVTVLDADGWYTVADDTPAADASTAVTATTVEPTVPSTASEVIQEVSPVQANENVQKQEDAPVETLSSDIAENDEAKLLNIDTTNTTITTTTLTTYYKFKTNAVQVQTYSTWWRNQATYIQLSPNMGRTRLENRLSF